MKAIKFYEWIENLKAFMKKDQKKLTEQMNFKLGEILQFVEQYSSIETKKIEFVEKEVAVENDAKRLLL
jgi:Asp-tRNA(Asn)/Glu-tRNA(Gln) amidotransferase C subunit